MAENEKVQADEQVKKQTKESQDQDLSETDTLHEETEEENSQENQAPSALMKTIAEQDSAIQELKKKYQRLQADFENFRRRSRQEKEELSGVVAEGIVFELLPVVDNFERALVAPATDDAAALRSGVEMIFRQMKSALEKLGVSVIEAKGKPFDPNEHQAVMRVEDAELEDGLIVEELQKGYKVKGRVVRPSMVKVVNNN